jgi:hypothetical protein
MSAWDDKNEKILHGARTWQHVIVPIGTRVEGKWIVATKMTHRLPGRGLGPVCKGERYEPVCGWPAHFEQHRKDHPELEQYWDESRACYPQPLVLPGAAP